MGKNVHVHLTLFIFMFLTVQVLCDETQTCQQIPKMDVLGRGYDILSQSDRKQALAFKYSQCLTTLDGAYQVADNVVVQSRRYTQIKLYSELIEDWGEFSMGRSESPTSTSIVNMFGGRSEISGSFSPYFQTAKKYMVNYKSVVARSQVRSLVLSAYIDDANPAIEPVLLEMLNDAEEYLDAGHVERARYVLGKIVRDYGTHFSSSVDLGGLITEDNYILAEFVNLDPTVKPQIAQIASQDFLNMLKFRNEENNTVFEKDLVKQYRKNRVFSVVQSLGGSSLSSNMSLESWVGSIADNVVPVSRDLQPLVNLISSANFPHVSNDNLKKLRNQLSKVTERYVEYNTHLGCTAQASQNFDYTANIDDGSCRLTTLQFGFGGMYQQCQMAENLDVNLCETMQLNGVNPFTNDYSCLPNYQKIVILNTTAETEQCSSTDCSASDECARNCIQLVATWCAPNLGIPPDKELQFGGLYSSLMTNPVTGRHSCPATYIPSPLGPDVKVCVSASFDLGSEHSVPFGGFFSCNQGNPNTAFDTLASHWAKACPAGFSEHVATFDHDCVLKYCMKGSVFTVQSELPLLLPPFVSSSVMFQDNSKKTVKHSGLSSGTIVAIAVGTVLAVVVLILLIIAAWKRRKRHIRARVESADDEETLIQTSPKEPHYQSFHDTSSSSHRE